MHRTTNIVTLPGRPSAPLRLVRMARRTPADGERGIDSRMPAGVSDDRRDPFMPLSAESTPAYQQSAEEAFERGREAGRREAHEEWMAVLAQERTELTRQLENNLAGFPAQLDAMYAQIERHALQFALAVASRLVNQEVQRDDQVVVRQIREAVRRVVGVETITLRIHPDDEKAVREQRTVLMSSLPSVRDMVIQTDESVGRGGCVIESSSGNVDARRATQLQLLDKALFRDPRLAGEEGATPA